MSRPWATRVWFAPAFRFVPRWLTANFVTLLGFAATLSMFLLAVFSRRVEQSFLATASFLALQAYVVADHLDGMQALASGTASKLGEFLDHFLDSISGCFVAFACFELMPGIPEGVRASVLALYLLAFIATYQERAGSRRLHFARFGALEGILVITVFFVTSAFAWGRSFWAATLLGAMPGYGLVAAIAYATFGGTVLTVLRRMGTVPRTLLFHAIASAILASALTLSVDLGALNTLTAWAVLSLHGTGYLARVMQPHLFEGGPGFDVGSMVLALVFLAAAAFAPSLAALHTLNLVTLVWVTLRAITSTIIVLAAYRDAWVWVNPDRT